MSQIISRNSLSRPSMNRPVDRRDDSRSAAAAAEHGTRRIEFSGSLFHNPAGPLVRDHAGLLELPAPKPKSRATAVALTAIGPESHQRWQYPLPEGEIVRIGRAPRHGWQVAWDPQISREHANLIWRDGQLQVNCLDMARNLIVVDGTRGHEFLLNVGDSFRIGQTRFLISTIDDEPAGIVEEIRLAAGESPTDWAVAAGRRWQVLRQLPEIFATAHSDEDLAGQLTALLLQALPDVQVAATARFASATDLNNGARPILHWESRAGDSVSFTPSLRLIRAAVHEEQGVLRFFDGDGRADEEFTSIGPAGWAMCAPLAPLGDDGWCLYAAGTSDSVAGPEALRVDLKFTELLARFAGAIRQLRRREQARAGLSHFLSPAVMETLAGEHGETLLASRFADMTVMHCDVRDASQTADDPADDDPGDDLFLLLRLNRISKSLAILTAGIVDHDGALADARGDAALGFWGWPIVNDDGAVPAARAALDILDRFTRAKANSPHPLLNLAISIGLAQGRAVAGRIGSDEQSQVGVIGPAVSCSAWLRDMTRILNAPILIDQAVAAEVRDQLPPQQARTRSLGTFLPRGATTPVTIHELLPPCGAGCELSNAQIYDFETAMVAIATGDWPTARFILKTLPASDGPRTFYLDYLARQYNTPPGNWNGVTSL